MNSLTPASDSRFRPGRRALIAALFLTAFLWAPPAAAQQLDDLWESLLDQPFSDLEDGLEESSSEAPPVPDQDESPAEVSPPPPDPNYEGPSLETVLPEPAPDPAAAAPPDTPEIAAESGDDAETPPDSLGWLDDYDWLANPGPEAAAGLFSPSSFEELLADREGREFQHEGRTYLWRDGVAFEKNEDGTLSAVAPPENLYEMGTDGRKWLSREADGTIYINVAPKIWATINFAHDSDVIEDDSKPVLDVFGGSLSAPALARHRLIIAGHTNNLGRPEYNLKLSRRRAQSVARYLAENHRLDPGRLILHGYGDQRPIADNGTEEGLAVNRRVEFILLGPPTEE